MLDEEGEEEVHEPSQTTATNDDDDDSKKKMIKRKMVMDDADQKVHVDSVISVPVKLSLPRLRPDNPPVLAKRDNAVPTQMDVIPPVVVPVDVIAPVKRKRTIKWADEEGSQLRHVRYISVQNAIFKINI